MFMSTGTNTKPRLVATKPRMNEMSAAQEQAFWEGAAAARNFKPASENPYTEKALFDPEQRADWWFKGHKATRDAKAAGRRKARAREWNRA